MNESAPKMSDASNVKLGESDARIDCYIVFVIM